MGAHDSLADLAVRVLTHGGGCHGPLDQFIARLAGVASIAKLLLFAEALRALQLRNLVERCPT